MVASDRRCVIIGAAPNTSTEFIASRIRKDDYIICADGGADRLVGSGIVPDLIIGDLDSSKSYSFFKETHITVLPTQKDDTDTMYCTKKALENGFKRFLYLGATGGRIDHTLANLSVLMYLKAHGAHGMISDEFADISLLCSGENVLSGVKGKTISIMPFACGEVCLTYEGMFYPMSNERVTADYPFTISNVAVAESVKIILHSGTALLIIVNKG